MFKVPIFKVPVVLLATLFATLVSTQAGAVPTPNPPPGLVDEAFASWLTIFRQEAIAAGVSGSVFDQAMRGVRPDPQVVTSNDNQPEFVRPVWDYLASAISDTRVANGQAMLQTHARLLGQLEERYGVDREVVVAIWGLETGYGAFMGTHKVTRALATLAYSGRRMKFGREQLLAALKILQRGDIEPQAMTGSWAGAMGHTQFIPTTYNAHAVDFDGDGKRDIWNNIGDALGSTGNYLGQAGWLTDAPWGAEVVLPAEFNYALADKSIQKPLAYWAALGVRLHGGGAVDAGARDVLASLILPAGHKGPAFLIRKNFRTVLRYNNSTSYSLAVNLLADRFRGQGHIRAAWPTDDRPLGRTEREELQRLLTAKGHDTQGFDGIIGGNTRKALRAWQLTQGLPADGYPTAALLGWLRR
ncbi:MAG: murein transglycosylase [Rhodobiaceae bacterium]|nr:MAG: murein transglycosylase [Rhodobiaceae bacterium]